VNEWLDVLATSLIATVNTKPKVIGYVTTIRWVYYHPGSSMVILLFVASFLLALAVSYRISRLFRESAEAILSRFLQNTSARLSPSTCSWSSYSSASRAAPESGFSRSTSTLLPETGRKWRPTHTGGVGARDLPHSGRSPSGNRVVAPRVGLPGIRRAVLSPALEHERATGREGTRERHRGERTRRTDPLEFSGWFRSSARRRRPGRAPALVL